MRIGKIISFNILLESEDNILTFFLKHELAERMEFSYISFSFLKGFKHKNEQKLKFFVKKKLCLRFFDYRDIFIDIKSIVIGALEAFRFGLISHLNYLLLSLVHF